MNVQKTGKIVWEKVSKIVKHTIHNFTSNSVGLILISLGISLSLINQVLIPEVIKWGRLIEIFIWILLIIWIILNLNLIFKNN